MPTDRPSIYHRRPYDSSKHCGAPMDRSVEGLMAKAAAYRASLAELEELAKTQTLTLQQRRRFKRKGRMAHFTDREILKIQENGVDDRPCMNPKGLRTTHRGTGMCNSHCECKGNQEFHLSSNRYSRKTLDLKLREKIDEMEAANHDALDLEPMLMMLDAKVQLFLDEKQDFDPETVRSLAILTDTIRKTVETINNKKFQASISVEMYNLILFKMGEVVADLVKDQEILDKILQRWDRIAVETAPKRLRAIIENTK